MQEQESWDDWRARADVKICSGCGAFFHERDLERFVARSLVYYLCEDCRKNQRVPAAMLLGNRDRHEG